MGVSVRESGVRPSYAKVNLHLQIGPKRMDGFHDLFSLFHLVSLHDDISIRIMSDGKSELSIEGMEGIPPESNLMGKAVRLFLKEVKSEGDSVFISIVKRIPMQGGLGGGSSNAATVLLTLNELYDKPLSSDTLASLALAIGSDVPFFIYRCAAALVEGRGERVTPIPARNDLWGLIAFPEGEGISTAAAFRGFDELSGADVKLKAMYGYDDLCHMYNSPVNRWDFTNDFRNVVEKYNDVYINMYDISENNSSLHGTVSGSGAAFIYTSDTSPLECESFSLMFKNTTQVTYFEVKYLNKVSTSGTLDKETSK